MRWRKSLQTKRKFRDGYQSVTARAMLSPFSCVSYISCIGRQVLITRAIWKALVTE